MARRLAASSDLHEVLGLIIDTLRDSLHADRVSVFQYDKAAHELFATKAHGLSQDLRLPADKGIIGEAARTRTIVNIPDAYADPRFNPAVDKATGYLTRCMLTIPLVDFENQLVGVAQLLNKSADHGGVFGPDDELIATLLADQAAVALKRASLLEARRIKEKLEADLDVARKIQQASLAAKLPTLPGYDIAGHFEPADETAGDAYDVIDLRACADQAGTWAARADALVFMADATGHGIGPALSVAQVLAMVRMGCRLGAELDNIALQANRQLCCDLPMGRFVTSFMGELSVERNELSYVSAGQAPIVFLRARPQPGEEAELVLNSNAMPLGIDEDFRTDRAPAFVFRPGDVFLMLSDGYYEASDARGDMFGTDRVLASVRAHIECDAVGIIAALRKDLAHFCGKHPADDDRTAIVIKRRG
ncbi:MAG: GAF domain-containing SpoIIE family protein phosphatase [Planctomycetota bacterium]|nr:GAF domain-containing SpoIIE family protein phosphatase [Planctomycetota bacterium]